MGKRLQLAACCEAAPCMQHQPAHRLCLRAPILSIQAAKPPGRQASQPAYLTASRLSSVRPYTTSFCSSGALCSPPYLQQGQAACTAGQDISNRAATVEG